jgi:uncharacterized phage infection (PIP) family protein YhgE
VALVAGPGFLSDAAAMTQAIQGFTECAANAKKTMSDLENELTSTLAQYQGSQAIAFWNLHTELQEQMTVASREIDVMSDLVNKSFQNYGAGDQQVSDTLRQVASSAGASNSVLSRLGGV